MIKKTFEISKLNLNEYSLYLFYGENDGYKNEIINNKFQKTYSNQIYRYDEKDILEKKNDFFNSILSKSFFEDKKLIIISRATDKILYIIEEIQIKKIKDIKIILLANILEKKSKLRNYFEKEKDLLCIAFYSETNQVLNSLAYGFIRDKKIHISQEIINLLIERCKGDRKNLSNELEKIENFSKYGKKIKNEDIIKLTNLSENYSASELVDNCLTKNIKKTSNILNENNYSNDDCIIILRTILAKAKRILKLQEEVKKSKNIDKAITNFKPPIFWKDKEIVKKQMLHWPLDKINNMIININEIELNIKKNSSNSLNIVSDFIINQTTKTSN